MAQESYEQPHQEARPEEETGALDPALALGGLKRVLVIESSPKYSMTPYTERQQLLHEMKDLYRADEKLFFTADVGTHKLNTQPEEYLTKLVAKQGFLKKDGCMPNRFKPGSPLGELASLRKKYGLADVLNEEFDDYLETHPERKAWLDQYTATRLSGSPDKVRHILIQPLERLDVFSAQENYSQHQEEARSITGWGASTSTLFGSRATDRMLAQMQPIELLRSKLEKLHSVEQEPELAKLTPEDRKAVCTYMFDKIYEYHRLLDQYGERELTNRRLFEPAEVLKSIYEERNQKEQEAKEHAKEEKAIVYSEAVSTEFNELMNNDRLEKQVTNFEPLTTTYITGEQGVLKKEEVGGLIHDHLKLAAHYKAQKVIGQNEVTTALWAYWNKPKIESIGQKLIGKFNGTVQDLRFVALPVEKEYYDEFVENPEQVNIDDCVRFGIAIDLKSSGKPAISNVMDVMMYVRNIPERGKAVIVSVRGRSKNEDLIEFLHLDSVANAYKIEVEALKRPFSAGLPSLGKR